MTRLHHLITIQRPLKEVFALAKNVDRYPEFLPGYLESQIIGRSGEALLLKRAAMVQGRIYRWVSSVRFVENRSIHFEQTDGALRGMRVDWRFEALSPLETRVTITHIFDIHRTWAIAWFLERFVYRPRIHQIASNVTAALKRVCERQELEVLCR